MNREEQILLFLKRHDYGTREQLQILCDLGGDRNAQKILRECPYLASFTHERKKVYYLNREGRALVKADKVRKKTNRVDHYLMRTDLFLHLGRPMTWKNEMRVKTDKVNFIADAVFSRNKVHHFVEIDNTQRMNKNVTKIKKYRLLSGVTDFVLIWLTTSEFRKKRLKELSEGLNVMIFCTEDIR